MLGNERRDGRREGGKEKTMEGEGVKEARRRIAAREESSQKKKKNGNTDI